MNFKQSMINPVTPLVANDSLTMVATAKNFLTPEECQQVIDYSKRAAFNKGTIGQKKDKSSIRSSKIKFVTPGPEIMWLFERLEMAITQMNNAYKYHLLGFYEGVQIASYKSGGKYNWHIDIGPGQNSNRKLSMSVQLTDPDTYKGGNLEFMNVDSKSERAIGTLIVFPSFLQHRVTPVIKGTRHSMVAWVHGNPYS